MSLNKTVNFNCVDKALLSPVTSGDSHQLSVQPAVFGDLEELDPPHGSTMLDPSLSVYICPCLVD